MTTNSSFPPVLPSTEMICFCLRKRKSRSAVDLNQANIGPRNKIHSCWPCKNLPLSPKSTLRIQGSVCYRDVAHHRVTDFSISQSFLGQIGSNFGGAKYINGIFSGQVSRGHVSCYRKCCRKIYGWIEELFWGNIVKEQCMKG